MCIVLIFGYITMIDDNGRINQYNKKSLDIPQREELLYGEKYKSIEAGNLFIEDMWYLMLTDVSNSKGILKEEGFHFIDLDNISDSYRLNTNIINGFFFGDEINEDYKCKLESDNSLVCFLRDNDTKIKITNGKYLLFRDDDETITEKDRKDMENFEKKINNKTIKIFESYIKKKYNCEYQINCQNLNED